MGHAVDYADVYFQAVREESWSLEDGIVKDGAYSIDRGVGVRALAGERTGFAYSDDVVFPALIESALAARAIARSGSTGGLQAWHARGRAGAVHRRRPIDTLDDRDKMRLLEQIDRAARALDPRISQGWQASRRRTRPSWCLQATARSPRTFGRWCVSTSP